MRRMPFFIFYSMFGFQRIGDLIWAACDMRCRGFLLGATAGRTTLAEESLDHDGVRAGVLEAALLVPQIEAKLGFIARPLGPFGWWGDFVAWLPRRVEVTASSPSLERRDPMASS